jgi:hypothetical protein
VTEGETVIVAAKTPNHQVDQNLQKDDHGVKGVRVIHKAITKLNSSDTTTTIHMYQRASGTVSIDGILLPFPLQRNFLT